MKILPKIGLFIFLVLATCGVYSQNLDSLIGKLPQQKDDSVHYFLLKEIAIAYSDSNYSKCLEYWEKALQLAEKINKRNFVADTYHQIGYSFQKMGEFKLALKNFTDAADIYSFLNDKKNLGGVLNDIGLIYRNWGKYDKALENYLSAQKIFDEIADIEGSAMVSNSIGQIYYYRENYPRAIEYFIRYSDINTTLNNPRAFAGAANNIASAYLEIDKYEEALQFYLKALKIYDSLEVRIGVAIIRDNIGSLFYQKKQYDDALLYHTSALKIFRELNSPARISNTLKNIGMAYLGQERFNSAISYLNESLAIASNIGQKDAVKDVYQVLAEAYQGNGNYREAYTYLKLYDSLKDSIINAESISKIESLQAEYEAERRENELASINHQLQFQRKILYTFSGFLALFLVLSALLFRENMAKKKALKNIDSLKSKILDRVITTCHNIDIFQQNRSISASNSNTWQITPIAEGFPKSCVLHFRVDEHIFTYILTVKDPKINPEILNLTIFNIVTDVIKNNPDRIINLNTIIEQQLLSDSLTSEYYHLHYHITPILFNNNKVFNLADENLTIKQKGVLLSYNESQWLNLSENDCVYLYATTNEHNPSEDKKSVRKIFKSLVHFEFNEQKEVADNYLKSMELDNSVTIFALKV